MISIDWYLLAWKRAFEITGRSRRREFGHFLVLNVLAFLLLAGAVTALTNSEETAGWIRSAFWLCLAAIIVPKTTLTIRRLHDLELPSWLFLLGLVPFAGLVLDMFCLLADSNPRPNQWGVSPKFEETQRWMASLPMHAQKRG